MLSRRVLAARTLSKPLTYLSKSRALSVSTRLCEIRTDINVLDPDLNGSYPNPPPLKRQFRDPYGKWWDSQERRNYGEPIHEDNDVLGIFTTEKYTWTTPGKGAVMMATFVAAVLGLLTIVGATYPDKPAVEREFDLVEQLGGKEALVVS